MRVLTLDQLIVAPEVASVAVVLAYLLLAFRMRPLGPRSAPRCAEHRLVVNIYRLISCSEDAARPELGHSGFALGTALQAPQLTFELAQQAPASGKNASFLICPDWDARVLKAAIRHDPRCR